MKVLHLLAPVNAGGLERVVHSLAITQRKAGYRVSVAAILDERGAAPAFFPPLEREGLDVERMIVPRRAYLREIRAVRSVLRAAQPDVVHSHGYRTDVIDGFIARREDIPFVSTAHGFTGGPWKNRLYERLQRLALRRSDAVIAVSDPLARLLRASGVRAERLHVVPNAFTQLVPPLARSEAREAFGLADNTFVVGWVGRMVREKGLDIAIGALALIPDADVVLCAVGGGPRQEEQQARARILGMTNRIRWTGLVPEASRYFPAFDAYMISSRTEGLPISLFEAMACGIPTVATKVGGIPDVITSEHAMLVEPGQPRALADAIRSIRADYDSARRRAARARIRLADFGTDAWVERHHYVYEAAIRRHGE